MAPSLTPSLKNSRQKHNYLKSRQISAKNMYGSVFHVQLSRANRTCCLLTTFNNIHNHKENQLNYN